MIFTYNSSSENKIKIVNLRGELIDRNQATEMLEEINIAISQNENKLLLNLQDLKYLNSSGLNILINILTKARKSGGEVAICCVNKKISELLLITKLNHVFNVCTTTDEAMALLNK